MTSEIGENNGKIRKIVLNPKQLTVVFVVVSGWFVFVIVVCFWVCVFFFSLLKSLPDLFR